MMKVRTVVYIVPVVLLALAFLLGSTLLLRLFFLSVLVPVVSYLWTVLGIRGVDAEAEPPPAHCQVGRDSSSGLPSPTTAGYPSSG